MTPFLLLTGALGMILGHYLIWFYAPIEETMGLTQKIFYLHLPLAWWGLIFFFIVFVCAAFYLKTRQSKFLHLARAAGEIGELLAVLTVITGMIWGKTAWGVWWTWDPRLTTALVMCFVYGGWLILHSLDLAPERKAMICSVTGILAFLDVPLVFLSSRLWRSIHPTVFSKSGIAMTEEMLLTVLFAIGAFGLFCFGLLNLRHKILLQEEELKSQTENL
ncbi:MAG: cytochrome c biogenesis protein CcsA [Desulfovibrio sp.]|nr:cytochrome c biogenesis protein CcsA [Desulfovibrio sp.]